MFNKSTCLTQSETAANSRKGPLSLWLLPAVAVAATSLTACTPSIPPQALQSQTPGLQSSAQSDSGTTTNQSQDHLADSITWVVPTQGIDSEQLAKALSEASGKPQKVEAVPAQELQSRAQQATPTGNTVVLGLDTSILKEPPAETNYGIDYACVEANQSWYSVNKLPLPKDLAEVVFEANLQYLAIPDTQDDLVSAWWMAAQLPQYPGLKQAKTITLPADTQQEDAGQSDQAPANLEAPLLVASALLPWKTVDNTGTYSQWKTIESTCVPRPLYAAGNAAAIDWLKGTSPDFLVSLALGYPLAGEETSQLPELIEAVAPRPK